MRPGDARPAGLYQRLYLMLRGLSIKSRLRMVLVITVGILTFALMVMLRSIVSSHEASVNDRNTRLIHDTGQQIQSGLASMREATKYPITWVEGRPGDTYAYLSAPHRYPSSVLHTDLENQSLLIFRRNPLTRLVALFDMGGGGSYVKNSRIYQFSTPSARQPLDGTRRLEEDWFRKTVAAHGSACYFGPDEVPMDDAYLQDQASILFVSRAIINVERFVPVGVILVALDMRDVTALYQQRRVFDAQSIGFFDADGKRLWGDMDEGEVARFRASGLSAGEEGVTVALHAAEGIRTRYHLYPLVDGTYCVLATPHARMLSLIFRERAAMGALVLLGFVLISLCMNAIIHSILRPIRTLAQTCNRIVEEGDFSIAIDDPGRDEPAELAAALDNLTRRIEYLIYEVYEKKMELDQTEIQLLRSQVNPHFLYNTLETIRAKAYMAEQAELSEMTLLLSSILRYGVSAPSELVTVRTELEKLEEYIRLQNLLYENRYVFAVNVEPSMLSHRMIKFVMQPLVENAINHGISPTGRPGRIDILGYRDEEAIVLKVMDDGRGIGADALARLREHLEGKGQAFPGSIGLRNVHRRIRLYYGDAYGIEIQSRAQEGTMVTVRIPVVAAPGQEGGRGDA